MYVFVCMSINSLHLWWPGEIDYIFSDYIHIKLWKKIFKKKKIKIQDTIKKGTILSKFTC